MLSAFITICVIIVFVGICGNIYKWINPPVQPTYDKEFYKIVDYIGGCKEILDAGFKAVLFIKEDKIELKTNTIEYGITIDKILETYLQSEEEIHRDVTLGRLILVGALAFGLRKTTKDIRKYIVIKFLNKKGNEDTIILESKDFREILETINNFKIKYEQILNGTTV